MSTRKYLYPILVIIVSIGFYYLEDYLDEDDNTVIQESDVEKNTSRFFYLPTSTTGSIIIHNHYSLSYSETHEQAEWVAYELKKEHLSRNEFKRPYFIEDKKVKTSSADWRNFKNSGYNKGHLCPAGDRRFTYDAFEETFLTSNISPQNPQFNGGIWNNLEKQTRYWAKIYNGVYVITGGVLSDNLKTIGYENVAVPEYFYKVVFDANSKNAKMIAFLIPNKNLNQPLETFAISVNEIEKLTKIDFFPELDNEIENRLEASLNTKNWKF